MECALPGDHLVQHRAEGKEVGAHVERLAADLLWGHVADRPHHGARIGDGMRDGGGHFRARRRHGAGEAEVQDLHVAIGRDEDVLGLEVAMDDAALVSGRKTAGDLHAVLDGATQRQRAGHQSRAEGLAFEQFHHEGAPLEAVDLRDVRMIQRCQRPGFALEAPETIGVIRKRFR